MQFTVKSLKETERLAKQFAHNIKSGDVVILNGDLGAGKTTFTQFVFHFLGVTDVVNSPTFAILKSYKGKFNFHHIDAYRITNEEAIEIGLDELFENKNDVFFVEWAENISALIPKKVKTITIKYIDETTREFNIDE